MTVLRHAPRLGLLLVALAGAGCIIIPLPDHGHLDGRNAISRKDTEWLVPGETTVADVLLAYGEPERIERDGQVLIYSWTVSQGIIAVGAGYGGDAAPIPRNYLLVIRFDEDGVLEQAEHTEARWFQTRAGRVEQLLQEPVAEDTP